MFCKYCGKEIPDGSVCDCEGAKSAAVSSTNVQSNPGDSIVMRIKSVFTDQIFLIILGLYILGMVRYLGLDPIVGIIEIIFDVLIVVFLFQFYNECKRSDGSILDTSPLKRFNVILTIFFVLCIIGAVIFLLISLLFFSLSDEYANIEEFFNDSAYSSYNVTYNMDELDFPYFESLSLKFFSIISLILTVVVVISAIFYKKLKNFSVSIIETINSGRVAKYSVKGLVILLYILAILQIISFFAFNSGLTSLGSLAIAVVYIMMTFLIKNLDKAISGQ